MVGGFDLFNVLCDEKRFYQLPPKALQGGDPKAAKYLFTAPAMMLQLGSLALRRTKSHV
jgi:hypothetical protein